MPLREELASNGTWLFRHRSYLPLLALGLVLIQLRETGYLGGSHDTQLLWSAFCLLVGLLGLIIRVHVGGYAPLGTSQRGTRAPDAAQVSSAGFYSVVRHPLYLANVIMYLSIVMYLHVWWLLALVALALWIYYERIMFAEEEMLRGKFGAAWLDWASRTPAFLPRLSGWRAPERPFSLRQALRREYAAFFGLIAALTVLEIAADLMATGRLQIDLAWGVVFVLGLAVFLALRHLTKNTRVLDLPASSNPTGA